MTETLMATSLANWVRYVWGFNGFIALLVALRIFVFDLYYVSSGSMEPTVMTGETVLICRLCTPHSGDVVVFDPPFEHKAPFLKRAVAMTDDAHFVALGDNTKNSYDSRFWGTAETEKVRGVALLIYLSTTPSRIWTWLR